MLEPNFFPFPALQTLRLNLRRIEAGDAADFFQLRSDPRVMEFMDRPLMKTIEEAQQMITAIHLSEEKNEAITWGISLKDQPKLIGTIGFWRIIKEHYRAEIGYLLHPDHWRKGLVQEALPAVLAYGFDVMQLHSVEANVNPNNKPSIAFLEKNGFVREAHFKENYFYNGQFFDSYIYSMLTSNFKRPYP